MTADMLTNKKPNPIVTELLSRGGKLNIYLVFITQCYFNSIFTFFIVNYIFILILIVHTILWWKFQTNESFNKSHSIIHQILTLKTLWIFTKKNTAKPYSYLVIDATLASDNPSGFRKNLSERI